MSFLELKNIRKSYYLNGEEFPVLHGVNLNCDLGEFVSILGESGGGKSTLMNIIGGLDCNFQGSVTINGTTINYHDEKAMDEYRRQTIGYVYQDYHLISHLNVLDNVLVALNMTTLTPEERTSRAEELLQQVGLFSHRNKYPKQLSGGQKQRVAIARALAADPQIIIADEPTGALDSMNTQEILEMLQEIAASGKLVIAVTHSQQVAAAGTRVVHMVDGVLTDETRINPALSALAKKNSAQQQTRSVFINGTNTAIISAPETWSTTFSMAFKHFKYHCGRNVLIMIGLAIGLAAVLIIAGIGNGVNSYVSQQIKSVASMNTITVSRYNKPAFTMKKPSAGMSVSVGQGGAPGGQQPQGGGMTSAEAQKMNAQMLSKARSVTPLTTEEIDQLKSLSHVTSVELHYSVSDATVKTGSTEAALESLTNWTSEDSSSDLVAGSAPQQGDIILSQSIAKAIEGNDNWKDLIGKTVTVSFKVNQSSSSSKTITISAKVSGITRGGGMASVNALNTTTLKDALENAGVTTNPASVIVTVDNYNNALSVTDAINQIKSNGTQVYEANSVASQIAKAQSYVSLASSILTGIASISLIVSVFMIIITMYMSVAERTKEIGVLRALGEAKRDIRWLFIDETFTVGIGAAIVATIVSLISALGLNAALSTIAKYSFIQIQWQNVITIFIVSILMSLIAAVLPARHAAALNPIDALASD